MWMDREDTCRNRHHVPHLSLAEDDGNFILYARRMLSFGS